MQDDIQNQRLMNIEEKLGIKFGLKDAPKDRLTQSLEAIITMNETLKLLEARMKNQENAWLKQFPLNDRLEKLEKFVAQKEANTPVIVPTSWVAPKKKSFWDRIKP